MDEMEEKLGAILNNPQMMQQIMALAQSMNQSSAQAAPQVSPQAAKPEPSCAPLDMNMLNRITNIARKANIDSHEQTLLKALSPYLSGEKIGKLERAMQAAKMAGLASSFLGSGGLQMLSGR